MCDIMEPISNLTPMSNFTCFVSTFTGHRNSVGSPPATHISVSLSQRRRAVHSVVRKRRGCWRFSMNDEGASVESSLPGMINGEKQDRKGVADILEEIRQRLEKELPDLFTSESANYSLYTRDVLFEDPLNKFRGAKRYASNISFLKESPVFTQAKFYLHSSRTLPDRSTVRTRWTLQMTVAALPWKPTVIFTGISDYRVDISSKLVTGHYDYWDSLSSSAFFSPPAVVDLVSQCTPRAVLPFESLPPFVLLRRTQRLQVWKFDSRVTLVPVSSVRLGSETELKAILQPIIESPRSTDTKSDDGYNGSDTPQQDGKSIGPYVAVARIDGGNPTSNEAYSAARALRSAVTDAPFSEPTDNSWSWIRVNRGGKYVHFVWIELAHVDMSVETGQAS